MGKGGVATTVGAKAGLEGRIQEGMIMVGRGMRGKVALTRAKRLQYHNIKYTDL